MLLIGLTLALAASEVPPASPAAAPKPGSAQAIFDAATAAADEGRCTEAVASFEALEARAGTRKNSEALAVMRIRKADCLLKLQRVAEATTAFQSGLGILNGDDQRYRFDKAQAQLGLGKIAYMSFDYPEAKRQFGLARSGLQPDERFDVLVWLTRVTMFDEGSEALGYANEAMALAATALAKSPKQMANVQTLHARVLLNHGAQAAAYAELKKALAAKGGLTQRVRIDDIVTRSDLAMAALLNGDKDSAREYLAYTGAGRSEKAPFASAASMTPPPCGGPAEGLPDDVAIIEFGVNDDGTIIGANPIYASRLGPMAVNYARIVAGWSWRPEDAVKLSAVFRSATRVELRCSTSFERPTIDSLLRADLITWLYSKQAAPFAHDNRDAVAVEPAKLELARRRQAGETVGLIPVLLVLGENAVTPPDAAEALFEEARGIAATAGAPATAQLYFQVQRRSRRLADRDYIVRYHARLREALVQPAMIADARASAALRLLIAEPLYQFPSPSDAYELLAKTVADTRLPPGDALRISTLVRLAALQAKTGNLAAARASYEQTGLDAQQCALVDATPALKRSNVDESDFPQEAMRWGFEGWVKTEYDINADGRTARQRALIAYPPFVFRDAAVSMTRNLVYQPSYRPTGAAGCGGAQQNINFRLISR